MGLVLLGAANGVRVVVHQFVRRIDAVHLEAQVLPHIIFLFEVSGKLDRVLFYALPNERWQDEARDV